MTVNKERVQLLVDALRSGEFEQYVGGLKFSLDGETRYCCLGVATEVALRHGVVVEENTDRDSSWRGQPWGHSYQIMCPTVASWYGFPHGDPELEAPNGIVQQATRWNDEVGATFDQIADMFEATYLRETVTT